MKDLFGYYLSHPLCFAEEIIGVKLKWYQKFYLKIHWYKNHLTKYRERKRLLRIMKRTMKRTRRQKNVN